MSDLDKGSAERPTEQRGMLRHLKEELPEKIEELNKTFKETNTDENLIKGAKDLSPAEEETLRWAKTPAEGEPNNEDPDLEKFLGNKNDEEAVRVAPQPPKEKVPVA